ncbi:hypothetical protein DLJ49_02205 [Rhodovulum sp. 12E13]|uniref:hypothetical protein n=1 Tax=Rhodovulum sp. 12E13 TaxID=2203891 RepID=UPI000E1ACA02|nr:hypothetical protein [Rhodovulum sp. 12E13]RDC74818.1 hypothetical protein DLJ49_02205 [Rhodovulum sp. 12E13]
MIRPAAALAVALGVPAVAPAQPADRAAQITPYVWATGIGGSIRPVARGPELEFDSSFSEVLEDLDGAFFVSGLVRQGRFVALGDFSTSTSSRGGTLPPGLPAEGEVTQSSLTLAAGYRAQADPAWTIDFLAGVRFWTLDAQLDVPALGVSASRDVTFADPILAARTRVSLADDWSLIVYGDVGGFGVGSEQTGQVMATVNYAATDRLYLSAGYRQLHVDYEDDGVAIDATFSGPILGVTFAF